MILTKIELGEIDPDEPGSGIQYGDWGGVGVDDMESVADGGSVRRRRKGGGAGGGGGLRDWEEVFRVDYRRGRSGCC